MLMVVLLIPFFCLQGLVNDNNFHISDLVNVLLNDAIFFGHKETHDEEGL